MTDTTCVSSVDECATIARALQLFRDCEDYRNAFKLLKSLNQTEGVCDAMEQLKKLVSEGELRRLGQLRASVTSFLPGAIAKTRGFVAEMYGFARAVNDEAASLVQDIEGWEREAAAFIDSLPAHFDTLEADHLDTMIAHLDALRMVPEADKKAALLRQERERRVEERQISQAKAFESEGRLEEAVGALQTCLGAEARVLLAKLLQMQTTRENTKRVREAREFFEKDEFEKAMGAILSVKDKDADGLVLQEQISKCLVARIEMVDVVRVGNSKKSKGMAGEFFVFDLPFKEQEIFSLNWGVGRADVFSFPAAHQPTSYRGFDKSKLIQLGSTFVCDLTKGMALPVVLFIGKRKSNGHVGFLIGDAGSDTDRSIVMADPTSDTFPVNIEMSVISKARFEMLRERALAKIRVVKLDAATPQTPEVKEELDDDFDIGNRRGRGATMSLWSPNNAGRADLNPIELQLLSFANQRGDEAVALTKNLAAQLASARTEAAKAVKEHKAELLEMRDDYRAQLAEATQRYDVLVRQVCNFQAPIGRQPLPAPLSPSPESVSAKPTTKVKEKRGAKKGSKDFKKVLVPAKRGKDGGSESNGESDVEPALSSDGAHVFGCMCDACQTDQGKLRLKKKTKK